MWSCQVVGDKRWREWSKGPVPSSGRDAGQEKCARNRDPRHWARGRPHTGSGLWFADSSRAAKAVVPGKHGQSPQGLARISHGTLLRLQRRPNLLIFTPRRCVASPAVRKWHLEPPLVSRYASREKTGLIGRRTWRATLTPACLTSSKMTMRAMIVSDLSRGR